MLWSLAYRQFVANPFICIRGITQIRTINIGKMRSKVYDRQFTIKREWDQRFSLMFKIWFIDSPGSNNLGRLLTPEEGCGFQPRDKMFLMQHQSTWPWMGTLLSYSDNKMLVSNCSKSSSISNHKSVLFRMIVSYSVIFPTATTLITSKHTLTSANCASTHPYVH